MKASKLSDQINVHMPWTDRVWRQLSETEEAVGSALFFGKAGLGKSHIALRYALKLLKHDEVLLSGNHPDLHVLMPESEASEIETGAMKEEVDASSRSISSPDEFLAIYGRRYFEKSTAKPKKVITVQQVRLLIQQVVQHSNLSGHKLVIIKSADKMNVNSANALLKTLEEPPQNTSFILLANHVEQLPITIRSRCRDFHFRAPDIEIGLQWLTQHGLENHLESYLMMANRSPLLALSMSEANEIENLRSLFSSVNSLWGRKKTALDLSKEWQGYEFNSIFKHLNQFLHDLLKLNLLSRNESINAGETDLFYPVQKEWSQKIATTVDSFGLIKCIDSLQSLQQLGKTPADKQLLYENAAIQLENLALNRA